jgi:hypothetical protein
MTERKVVGRSELTDQELATVLAEALAGRSLSPRGARQLAATLRRVTEALPPGIGNLSGLSHRLRTVADLLDAQVPRRLEGASKRTDRTTRE